MLKHSIHTEFKYKLSALHTHETLLTVTTRCHMKDTKATHFLHSRVRGCAKAVPNEPFTGSLLRTTRQYATTMQTKAYRLLCNDKVGNNPTS